MPTLLCEYAKPAQVSQERGKVFLHGPAFLANETNLNGRTYSESIIQKSVDKLKQKSRKEMPSGNFVTRHRRMVVLTLHAFPTSSSR